MNARQFLTGLITVAPITFVVAAVVSFIYNLIAHGNGIVDWGHSIRLAIVLGITAPLLRALRDRQRRS